MSVETWYLEEAAIQLIDGDRGKNYPNQSDFMENGSCLFLSAKNVTKNGFDFSEQIYVSKEKDNELRAGKLTLGDVVVTTRGTIGNVAFYDSTIPFDNIRINSGMMIFRADENIWNRRFLYFLLTSEVIKQQIISLTSGSAVPQLPARDLRKFKLPRMPLEIQNQIVEIIGSISDKIELNRQINQTLEQIAQTIFKSWFVDFEPVKAKIEAKAAGRDPERAAMCAISGKLEPELDQLPPKQRQQLAATAALFPDELVESELGLIPEGWEVKSIADISKFATGKVDVSALGIENYISTENMLENRGGVSSATSLPTVPAVPNFSRGQILISNIRPYFKKIWLARFDGGRSNDVLAFNAKENGCAEFLYNLLYRDDFFEYMMRTSKGAKMPRGDKDAISGWKFICADRPLRSCFSEKVRPYYLHIESLNTEVQQLSLIRDTLLPKLLSGDLSLEQAPAVMEGVV